MDTPAGALYVESDGVDRFTQTYDRLYRETLSPEQSAELLSTTADNAY